MKDEVEELRQEIISCLMYCEAEIDFGDTEEIDEDVLEKGGLTIAQGLYAA